MKGGTAGVGQDLHSLRLVGDGSDSNVVAGTTDECAAMASIRLVGEDSASHCGGDHDM